MNNKIDIYNPPLPKITIVMPWFDYSNDTREIENFSIGMNVYALQNSKSIIPSGYYEIIGFTNIDKGRYGHNRGEGINISYNNEIHTLYEYSNVELSGVEYIVYDKIYKFIGNFLYNIDKFAFNPVNNKDLSNLFDIEFKNEFDYNEGSFINIKSLHGKNDVIDFYFGKNEYSILKNYIIELALNKLDYLQALVENKI